MARTKTEADIQEFPVTETVEKNTQELAVALNANDMANAIVADAEEAFKIIGHIEAAQFMLTVSEKMMAESAIKIKKDRLFKSLIINDENGIRRHVSNFEEFCKFKLKKSRQRVEELVRNYNMLGPELYEQAEQLGFTQRDYNALKALPADDRLLIAQAIEEENLDRALDILQEMAAKHVREKEASAKKIDELGKTLEAKDQVLADKTRTLDKQSERIALLENAKRQEVDQKYMPGHHEMETLQRYSMQVASQVSATMRSEIVKLFGVFDNELPAHVRLAASQALGLVITAAYDVADDLYLSIDLNPETAANNPAKADAEAFQQWQAQQSGE